MQLLPPPAAKSDIASELSTALASCRSAFIATAVFSGMSNVLMLTGAIFMLEIYDRVLPSHSVPTLIALIVIAAALYAALGVLDLIRGRILVRVGASLDEAISDRVYDALVCLPLRAGNRGDGLQALRHLDNLRTFLSGMGPIAFFDLPWIPLYLVICFAFHPLIGVTALVGAIILCALTILTEIYTRDSSKQVIGLGVSRNSLAETSRRNAEALVAMGMNRRLGARWREANRKFIASQQQTSDVAGGFASISKVLRMLLQSAVLAVGAWLVINQQATAGIIIAGSILSARALAPVDLAIANWKALHRGAAKLARAQPAARAVSRPQAAPMALPPPGKDAHRRHRERRAAGHAAARRRQHQFRAQRRQRRSASSARAGRASRASPACWSACGSRRAAESASTARATISGRPRRSASISATCRRTSSC